MLQLKKMRIHSRNRNLERFLNKIRMIWLPYVSWHVSLKIIIIRYVICISMSLKNVLDATQNYLPIVLMEV